MPLRCRYAMMLRCRYYDVACRFLRHDAAALPLMLLIMMPMRHCHDVAIIDYAATPP